MMRRTKAIAFAVALSVCLIHIVAIQTEESDILDRLLLKSILPPPSEACRAHFARVHPDPIGNVFNHTATTTTTTTNITTFAFDFDNQTHPSSPWSPGVAPYEHLLFSTELSHHDPSNTNRSWSLRVGWGGNVYSFRGAYGEAVPPQASASAPWVDGVFQTVSVNQRENRYSGLKYFIHQAGTYTKDGPYNVEDRPFWSPPLARHCDDRACAFGSWGQQAHVPTFHRSDALYFNSYADCGGGVVEFTSVVHNHAEPGGPDHGSSLSYFNVPWAGVRQSVLRDVLTSDPETQSLSKVFPLRGWPDMVRGDLRSDDETGGYATFCEGVQGSSPDDANNDAARYPLPCGTRATGDTVGCDEPGALPLRLVVRDDDGFRRAEHTVDRYRRTCCGKLKIRPNPFEVRNQVKNCDLWFTNRRTGRRVRVAWVLAWAKDGDEMHFCPRQITAVNNSTAVIHQMNDIFKAGDVIDVTYVNEGKPWSDNLALTHVYGYTNPAVSNWASYRVRFGNVKSLKDDMNVYTLNPRLNVDPGDTYIYRQYLITGELSDMEEMGRAWVPEAYEDHFFLGELTNAEDVHLFSIVDDEGIFGATVGNNHTCGGARGGTTPTCSGKSVPGIGLVAHFAITCGNSSYVGSNKYVFASTTVRSDDGSSLREEPIVRPYVCANTESVYDRPTWKLLGYFADGDCQSLRRARYDPDVCRRADVSPVPTSTTTRPSTNPTSTPTATSVPSAVWSAASSYVASVGPSFMTGSPSLDPRQTESNEPSVAPTATPTKTAPAPTPEASSSPPPPFMLPSLVKYILLLCTVHQMMMIL